jgi:hypothetical protein
LLGWCFTLSNTPRCEEFPKWIPLCLSALGRHLFQEHLTPHVICIPYIKIHWYAYQTHIKLHNTPLLDWCVNCQALGYMRVLINYQLPRVEGFWELHQHPKLLDPWQCEYSHTLVMRIFYIIGSVDCDNGFLLFHMQMMFA